jgi:hypothetical protein
MKSLSAATFSQCAGGLWAGNIWSLRCSLAAHFSAIWGFAGKLSSGRCEILFPDIMHPGKSFMPHDWTGPKFVPWIF